MQEENRVERPVKPEQLTQAIAMADRVVVFASASKGGDVLFESNRRVDLDALSESLKVFHLD